MVNLLIEPEKDYFARVQYLETEHQEKLQRPEFEKLEAGIGAQKDIHCVCGFGARECVFSALLPQASEEALTEASLSCYLCLVCRQLLSLLF